MPWSYSRVDGVVVDANAKSKFKRNPYHWNIRWQGVKGIKSTHTSTWKHALRWTYPRVGENNGGPYIQCIVWWPRRVKLEQPWLYYCSKPGDGTVTRTLYANLVHTSKCFFFKNNKKVKFRQLMLHLKVVHEQLPVFVEAGWWNINDASTCEFGPRIADIVGCRTGVTS